jgi:glycolate oxidase iron-sulfur subunit
MTQTGPADKASAATGQGEATGPSPDFSSQRGEQSAPERTDHTVGHEGQDVLGSFGSFDDHHPPARELMDDCVHCGFCLPTCPTYALWGEEMDSPRGRIYLMEMAERGEIPLEGAFTTHIDRCLGCMACVTACPSGVQYDRLLEATRPQIERQVPRTRADRWFREGIFTLFPYKRRLRAASLGGALYQKVRPKSMDRLLAKVPERFARLVAMESLLPPVSVRDAFARLPARTPAVGPRRGRVGMLTGCVQDVFFHPVNEATARVLAAEGYDVIAPREQGCCGALGLHAGREEESIGRAKALIEVFERAEVDTVAVNVAGCGSSMKEYGELLADDPAWAERGAAFSAKVRDISEVLADALEAPRARRHRVSTDQVTVVYHDACHLGHAQKIREQPRDVIRSIPGVTLVELPEAAICCGSAGIYNMLQPEAAGDLGERKAENIRGTGADLLVTANPGCLLQIRKYLGGELPMMHPVQLLDASIRGVRPF